MMKLTVADVVIRFALKTEAVVLSNLTWCSKGYWGYNEEYLRDCGELLNIKASYIEKAPVYVAEIDQQIAGFYGLSPDNYEPELMYLQVAPEYIGKGLGRILWNHALAQAKAKQWGAFKIQADPHSVPFFRHMGAIELGHSSSHVHMSMVFPVLEYTL